jgi:hypothetical protein
MSTLPSLPLKNGCLEIDNSFLESFISCPRKTEYQSLNKRIYAGERPALNFGSAVHRALEYRYKTFRNEPPTALEEQDIFDNALVPYFAQNPQSEDDHRTLAFAQEIIGMYNQRFAHEPFSLIVNDRGEVMAEMSFAVPLFNYQVNITQQPHYGGLAEIPVIYTGRIDLPVLWDGQIFIGDFKTSGMLGASKSDEYKISPQFEGYCWAFQELTKKEVSGFFIRGIRTKSKPATTKGGWDKWWDECFLSHKEYLRPGQLDEWQHNTIALVEEFFWDYSRAYMPQKKKACMMYGKCPYYDVCYLPEEARARELASERYTENEWSPLK